MTRGIYISGLGMTTQMKRMDVVSNNIANVNTTGYKKDGVITRSFDEELAIRVNDPVKTIGTNTPKIGTMNMGLTVDKVYTDFSNGSFQKTDGNLDFGIDGDGYFTVQTVDGEGNAQERYTRAGNFTINPQRILMTQDGNPVMGENGMIVLPKGVPAVNAKGQIFVNDQLVDTLKMTDFDDKTLLRKEGDNLYYTMDGINKTPFNSIIEQGYLETSNVNTVTEMVEMITLSRVYEANQKAVISHDKIMEKAANEIGRK